MSKSPKIKGRERKSVQREAVKVEESLPSYRFQQPRFGSFSQNYEQPSRAKERQDEGKRPELLVCQNRLTAA